MGGRDAIVSSTPSVATTADAAAAVALAGDDDGINTCCIFLTSCSTSSASGPEADLDICPLLHSPCLVNFFTFAKAQEESRACFAHGRNCVTLLFIYGAQAQERCAERLAELLPT